MFAIIPKGIGKEPGARSIQPGWPLENGETFTVDTFTPGDVLAEDEASLRAPTQAEIIANNPYSYSPSEFRDCFTDAEQLAILTEQDNDANLKLLVHKLYTSPVLSTDSVTLQQGIAYLVSKGLIDQSKADDILNKYEQPGA